MMKRKRVFFREITQIRDSNDEVTEGWFLLKENVLNFLRFCLLDPARVAQEAHGTVAHGQHGPHLDLARNLDHAVSYHSFPQFTDLYFQK